MRIIFSLLIFLSSFHLHGKVVEKIIAVVNDQIITLTDLNNYRTKLRKNGLVDESLLQLTDRKALLSDRKKLTDHLINERLIDSLAAANNQQVTFEKVDAEIRKIARGNGITKEQLKEALSQRGVRFSEYQDFIRTSIQRKAVIDSEVASKIKISDDDITTYYIDKIGNKKSLVFSYSLAQILFLKKDDSEAAKARAEEVYQRLRSGDDFNRLASQYSEDPSFSQGGYLGDFRDGELNKTFQKAVSGLDGGQYSGVVETGASFHILKVIKKTIAESPVITREKENIRRLLTAEEFSKQFKAWLEQKRREAFIKIN